MSYLSVDLEPIDPMLFGDNRMARAGEDHILSPQAPSPFTIFGAIGQFIAREFGVKDDLSDWDSNEKAKKFLGEFLASNTINPNGTMELTAYVYKSVDSNIYFPAPRNFEAYKSGEIYYCLTLMKPASLYDNGRSSCPFDKILISTPHEKKLEVPFFVQQKELESILCGIQPSTSKAVAIKIQSDFFLEEFRSGLKMINKKNVTEEAHLFNRPYWRFISDYDFNRNAWKSTSITAWVKLKSKLDHQFQNSIGFLGGDRRRSVFNFSNSDELPFSDIISEVLKAVSNSDGFFAYLITPLPVLKELYKIKIDNKDPICAAIGKPQYISGWEKTKGNKHQHPRPMLHVAPAGSVLFYKWEDKEKNNDELKKRIIKDNWLASLSENYYATFGFGRILIGVWKNGN